MILARTRKAISEVTRPDRISSEAGLVPEVFRGTIPGSIQAPPVANDDSYSTSDAAVLNGNLFDNDTPGDVPLQVTAVNGNSFAVGLEIVLPSGARLRVNADGSFTYNPNGAFDSIATTDDSFTYTIAGGDSGTVTVTVNDVFGPLIGTDNSETLTGTPNDDVMDGRGGNDTVNGLGGNDTIDGGTGADSLVGGTGNDVYKVDNALDTVTEHAGEGYDIVIATVNYALGAGVHVEELTTTPGRNTSITLTGNEFDNIVRGGQAADTLAGGGGNDYLDGGTEFDFDHLNGGTGDDVFIVRGNDLITEANGEGYDIVYLTRSTQFSQQNFTLNAGAYVELIAPLPLYQADPGTTYSIAGNELDNLIHGGAGNDFLRGNGGNDTLIGFAGRDYYVVESAGDVVIEEADGGHDTIEATFSYTLAEDSHVEDLKGGGVVGLTLIGNSFDNTVIGTGAGDLLMGAGGGDTLRGLAGNDSLYGGDGHDFLDGGSGIDLMDGGTGNDSYYVDHASDAVVEASGNGRDVVYATVSFALDAGEEIEVLSTDSLGSTAPISLTGNEFAQEIYGNAGNNFLSGGGGADQLFGLGGDDSYLITSGAETVVEQAGQGRDVVYTNISYVLGSGTSIEVLSAASQIATTAINLTGNELAQEIDGNAGNNFLNGGGGADVLVGFGGDDQYFITSGTETIVEHAGGGRDVAYTIASHVLDANIHLEVLSTTSIAGTAAINLTGNALVQELDGNNGTNILNGGGGADTLVGFGGDDTYYVTDGGEFVVEAAGGGRDVVYATVSYALGAGTAVEVLSTSSFGSTAAINLTGNELGQELYGNAGANVLNGGGGADYLAGLGGADFFDFTTALGGGNIDTILDMTAGSDKIRLDDAVFTGLAPGALPAGAFAIGATAGDADDRIVYNSATGQLFYDADGNGAGAAVQFATLGTGLSLIASDFVVI